MINFSKIIAAQDIVMDTMKRQMIKLMNLWMVGC